DLPPGGPCRTDLAHQHEMGRVRRQRLSDELVDDGGSVILSRIDVIDAAVDSIPQEGNGLASVCRRSKHILPRKPHGSETNWRHRIWPQGPYALQPGERYGIVIVHRDSRPLSICRQDG